MATDNRNKQEDEIKRNEVGQFVPGQTGNPAGRPRVKPFRDEIKKQLAANPEKLAAIVKTALDKAELGDDRFFKELRDMIDGKPAQPIEGSEDGAAVNVKINLSFE